MCKKSIALIVLRSLRCVKNAVEYAWRTRTSKESSHSTDIHSHHRLPTFFMERMQFLFKTNARSGIGSMDLTHFFRLFCHCLKYNCLKNAWEEFGYRHEFTCQNGLPVTLMNPQAFHVPLYFFEESSPATLQADLDQLRAHSYSIRILGHPDDDHGSRAGRTAADAG